MRGATGRPLMPEAKSEPTRLAEALLERMEEMYQTLVEAWPVPFGQERISLSKYRRRWAAMSDDERRAEIARIGVQAVLAGLAEGGA